MIQIAGRENPNIGGIQVEDESFRAAMQQAGARLLPPVGGGYMDVLPYTSGRLISNTHGGGNYTTVGLTATAMLFVPFFVRRPLSIDRIGAYTTTAGTFRVAIYSATPEGLPDTPLYASAPVAAAANAMNLLTLPPFAFVPDTLYWLALRASGALTLRAEAAATCPALAVRGTRVQIPTHLSLALPYADPDPVQPLSFSALNETANLAIGNVPSVFMRVV
jgi:hypothetical protein